MKATQKKHEGLSYEYEVQIPAKDLDQKVDAKLQSYSGQIRIPGFRPGKVPFKMLKQKHGKAVLGEVIEEAVQESMQKLMDDNKIRPALQPKIEIDKEYAEGKDLIYSVAIESLPEFKIMELKGMKLEKPVAEVEDAAIDEALATLAKNRRDSTPVTENRPSKAGDIVMIDYHGRLEGDGKPEHGHERPGMHAHDHALELGSGQFIPGFEDQLIGKKAGDEVEVKLTFPEEYHAEALSGKNAIFDVMIHEIREPSETKVDEDFAKSFGLEDLEALRNAVRDQLQQEYAGQSRMKLKRAILDQLDDGHDFDVPAGMIAMENEQIMRQVKMEQQQTGSTAEMTEEEKEELAEIAVRRVKLGLILADIGRNNNIMVTDAELQQAVIREAQRYPGQERHVFDFYAKNRNALESLRAPMFEEKVIDYIIELADVTEKKVAVEDLSFDEEDEMPKKKEAKKSSGKKKSEKSEEKS
ncbi:MAG: trigger factor [Rhodospirillales bacterium]|nr:trigger factor [Rhodospirillales bacterium]MCB9973967.1 trigger factor [Rhodospirillales bacterium]